MTRFRLIGVLMVAAVLSLVGSSSAFAATAHPATHHSTHKKVAPLRWSVSHIQRRLASGATETLHFTFTSTKALDNVTLRVSPKLGSAVTVSPTTIAHVAPNTPVQVTVTLTMPTNAPKGVGGSIAVLSNGRVVPASLGVRLRLPATKATSHKH